MGLQQRRLLGVAFPKRFSFLLIAVAAGGRDGVWHSCFAIAKPPVRALSWWSQDLCVRAEPRALPKLPHVKPTTKEAY